MSHANCETRTVNLRALLILLAAGVVLGGSAYATHHFQVKRNSRQLLAQADQAEAEGQPQKAADYVWQYLGMVPRDDEALARFGMLLAKQKGAPRERLRALFLIEQALRRKADQPDVRRVAARLAVELRLVKEARYHLDELRKGHPDDPELLLLRGRCEALARDYEPAAEAYASVVKQTPGDMEAWREYLAVVREGLGDSVRAESLVQVLITANPRSPAARVLAVRHFLSSGAADQADEHLRQALRAVAPDEETLLLAASVAGARGKQKEARGHLRQGLQLHPGSTSLRLASARLEAQLGETAQALELLEPLRRALPERVEQRWELGSLLADLGQTARAQEVLSKVVGAAGESARALLQAVLLTRKGAWAEARVRLEKLRAGQLSASLGQQVDLLRADCYLALGSPEQAVQTARGVLAAAPQSQAARLRLARALAASGKTGEAVAEYRRLASRDPEMRPVLARLLLLSQLALPEKDRRWGEVEKALDEVPPARRQDTQVVLLRADMLLARGRTDEARQLAEAARTRAPREVGPWLFLAELARRKGGATAYLAALDEAERRAGRRVEWALARTRQWTEAGDEAGRKQVQALAAALDGWPAEERERLSASLAAALARLGDQQGAEKLWREVARRRPHDLSSRLALLEAAAATGRAGEVRRLAAEIEQAEGGGGVLGCYARALAALLAARGDQTALAGVRSELDRALALRPNWTRLHVLLGDVELVAGRPDQAVRKYQAAIERGDTRLRVWQSTARLLFALRRFGEAAALLKRLPEQERLRSGFGHLAAELTLVNSDEPAEPQEKQRRALEMARQVVKSGRGDYGERLWLGQVAWVAGRRQEAEQAFLEARKAAPREPATWVALVSLLARVDPARARREVALAEKTLQGGKNALALVVCHELVGQSSQAEQFAARALREQPGDLAVVAEVAAFHQRNGRGETAEKLWREILDAGRRAPDALVRATRRRLAVFLALTMGYPSYKEALALIEKNLEKASTIEDRQVKALVLATQPAQRAEAIRLFEKLSPLAPGMPPALQLLLGQLYEAEGRWPQARACLLAVARREERNPASVAYAARSLMKHGEAEEAARLLEGLSDEQKQTPDAIELRGRLLYLGGKKADAIRLLESYRGDREDRMAPVAIVLDSLGESALAEKLLRRLAANPKQPRGLLLLAQHLGRHKQTKEALRLCERAWGRAPDEEVAVHSVFLVRASASTAAQRDRVAAKIGQALARKPRSTGLLLPAAELEDLAGRHDRAIGLFRRVLDVQPGNVVALNNLAYLLALKSSEHEVALRLVGTVLDAVGPVAEVLDTRGLIHLEAGRAAQAVKDFQAAVKQNPEGTKYMHLARAQLAAGERLAARAALARAVAKGLKEEHLHPLEQPAYRNLRGELAGD